MNNRITNPVGVDVEIDKIQKKTYTKLVELWGNLDMYGRVHKVTTKDGVSVERFLGNGEYEKVLFSEGNKVFFLQGDNPSFNLGTTSNDVWMICILDVNAVRPLQHRGDEEAHMDVVTILSDFMPLSNITAVEYEIANLSRVVEEPFQLTNFNMTDIHPFHVFMVKFKVNYSLIKNIR